MASKTTSMKRLRSQSKIINSLQKGDKRFTDLEKETGLSPAGLNGTLKVMKKENVVETILVKDKQKYRLTKKGENLIEKYLYLSYDIDAIRTRYGAHYRDYSTLYNSILASGFSWGIESDLTIDNEIKDLKLLTPKDVIEIEELVYKKIANNLKHKKVKKVQNGKMILGFSVDYNDFQKSIKQKSLAYINHMSKEETKILGKVGGFFDDLTEKEYKRLQELREKTYEKIKNLKY